MKSFKSAKRYIRRIFTLATSIIMVGSAIIIIALEFPIMSADFIMAEEFESFWQLAVLIFAVATLIIGVLLSFIVGKLILNPINDLLDGMERLSGGEYGTRIHFSGNGFRVVEDGFNSLASELEHTEIVRSDFINDFSHEFKTPLVSMKGLIMLMKSGKVPHEKQKEYFEIIEEETDRLTMMTTNVLNLSKIQNQRIVVDKCEYNLSEQIRRCLLLFEKRWTDRGLSLSVEMEEVEKIFASEELLRTVWLNLIDNAVKFADEGTEISLVLKRVEESVVFTVANKGVCIPDDELSRLFHKFYRGESTSSRPGNGIGLYITKNIVDLHGGEVSVSSLDGVTSFTVTLPVK